MDHARQEHYIAAVVTIPAPHDLEVAAQRSSQSVSVNEIHSMLSMYEPTSLAKLSKKGAAMHDAATKLGATKLSPRGASSPTSRGSVGARRESKQFREIPVDSIPEGDNALDESDSEEESKT